MGLKPTTIDRSPASTPLPPSPPSSEASSFKEKAATAKKTASAKGSLKSRSSSDRAEAGKGSNVALSKGSEEAVGSSSQAQQEGEAALKQGVLTRRRKSGVPVKEFTPPKKAPQGGNVGQDDAITPAPLSQEGATTGQVDVELSSEMQVAVAKWSDQALGHHLLKGFNDREAHAYARPIMEHARRSAQRDVDELLKGEGALNTLHKFWNKTTLAADMSGGSTYREKLAALQISDENPTLVLKAIDQLLDVIITDIKDLTTDSKEETFVKDKLLKSAEGLKNTVSRTAFANADMNTLSTLGLIAAASAFSVLPFYTAIASNPFGAYYLVALTNAYTRTIALTIGLMAASPAVAKREIGAIFTQRHVTWEATPAAFAAATAAYGYAVDNGDESAAQRAQDVGSHVGLILAAGALALAAYLVPEFISAITRKVDNVAASVLEKSKLRNQFEKGEIKLRGQEDLQRTIHQDLTGLTTLVSAVDENRIAWKQAGGKPSAAEDQIMTHMRRDLYDVLHAFERISTVEPPSDKQAVSEPGSKADGKKALAYSLALTGGAMGVVSSLSAIKSPALLSDYASYYIASTVLVAYTGVGPQFNKEDAERVFINQFSGTAIGLPTVIPNTLTLLLPSVGEGIFDLIKPGATEVKPPLMSSIPHLPGTKIPNLHPENGAVNLALGIAYQFLTTAIYGTRAGPVVAQYFIKALTTLIDAAKSASAKVKTTFAPERQSTPIADEERGMEMEQQNAPQIDPAAADLFIAHLQQVFDTLMQNRLQIVGPEPQDDLTAPLQGLRDRISDVGEPSGSAGPSKATEGEAPSMMRTLEGPSQSAQQSVVQFDPSMAPESSRSSREAARDKRPIRPFAQESVGEASGTST